MPFAIPMGFFAGATGVAAAPTIGAGTTLTNSTSAGQTTWAAAYTSSTGLVLVRASGRVQSLGLTSITFTVGGTSATVRAAQYGMASLATGQTWTWIGTATGVTTGSALAVVCTGDSTLNREVVMLNDISAGWGGLVGGSGANIVSTAGTGSIAASDTAAQTGRLWVGTSNALFNSVSPQSATGWTSDGETSTGSGGGTSNDGAFWHDTGPSAGATQTLTATSATTTTDWGCSLIELL